MDNSGLQYDSPQVPQKDKDPEGSWITTSNSKVEKGEGILLSWSNLTVQVPEKKPRSCFPGSKEPVPAKKLLNQVTGQAKPGELLAILGASGAGKSTLLNTLAFRNLTGLEVEGRRLANQRVVTTTSLTSVSGYVQQEELFINVLSVTEHLTFQSQVRMPKEMKKAERRERVEQVIKELGLAKSANTMIGNLSGGEKRRLSVASELLTDPKLLFCDEPTSGLDSHMAASVVDLLLGLAGQGRTVICTIHQPSSQVFATFDRLLLLAEGRTAYLGPARGSSKDFFASQGFPCPQDFNPADHLIGLLAVEPGSEVEDRARVSLLCDAFAESELGKDVKAAVKEEEAGARESDEEESKVSPYLATWPQQLAALAWRNWKTSVKDPLAARAKIGQAVILALILGVVYLQQDLDQKGIQNINGALFVLLTNLSFGNVFAVANIFCSELPVFKKEHYGGMYRVDTYFIAKQLVDLPLYLVEPVILTTILYWMVGLNSDVGRFFVACGIVLLVTQVVLSVGYLLSCVSPNVDVALGIAPVVIIPFMLFGGFFLNSDSVPVWLSWLKWISWFIYSYEALLVNQWSGVQDIACNTDLASPCVSTGEQVLQQLSFEEGNFARDIGVLVLLAVVIRLLAYLALVLKTRRGK